MNILYRPLKADHYSTWQTLTVSIIRRALHYRPRLPIGTAKDRAFVPFAQGQRNVPKSWGQMVKKQHFSSNRGGTFTRSWNSNATISLDKVQFLNLSHHGVDQAFTWDNAAKNPSINRKGKGTKYPSIILDDTYGWHWLEVIKDGREREEKRAQQCGIGITGMNHLI